MSKYACHLQSPEIQTFSDPARRAESHHRVSAEGSKYKLASRNETKQTDSCLDLVRHVLHLNM